MLILHPTISLNLFISSRIFLVEPLGFSIYKSVSSANRDNYTYAYKQILLVVFLWRFVIYTYVFLSLITVVICAENFWLSPISCYCSITVMPDYAMLWMAAHQASLSFTVYEFAQIRVHWVHDANEPFHPLARSAPFAFNLFQHQGPFKWVGSLHQLDKVLELQFQHQPFQWIFSWVLLWLTGLISLQSKGLSRVFSSTMIPKFQFFSTQPSLWPNYHIHTLREKI